MQKPSALRSGLLLGLLLALFLRPASAQQQPEAFNVKTYNGYPAFPLFTLDSVKTSSTALRQAKKATVIVYFSPTCSHCQHFTEALSGRLKELKNIHILMVSGYDLAEIRQFNSTYGVSRLPNFSLAYDPGFNMGRFFVMKELPGVFVYNKEGQLVKLFEGAPPVDKLMAVTKDL
ncbi:MAG TPA: redoxin domain-containing protein [Phnomibacter sp.]|nr:redoxin domain-containing protein [Phnomibacter sp.]